MKSAMSNLSGSGCTHEQWARFRFSVIGPLLAAPPEWGDLQEQLKSLAAKKWHHRVTAFLAHPTKAVRLQDATNFLSRENA
jgi:hypothetical protein